VPAKLGELESCHSAFGQTVAFALGRFVQFSGMLRTFNANRQKEFRFTIEHEADCS
jgi:hypothetical protein